MTSHVEGFVLPIPKRNAAAYRKMARRAGKRMTWGGFKVAVSL